MNEYYEKEALNYSTLAALEGNNPGAVFRDKIEKKSTHAMGRGSLVDCLLTDPDEFENRFIIGETTVLNDNLKEIFDNIQSYTDEEILRVARFNSFGGKNWSDEVILKRIKTDETLQYYNEKTLTTDKIKISQTTYDQAIRVIEVLKNHEYSSWIFNSTDEVLFQVPIYWNEKDINCKALLDIVIIDHNNKRIQPIDLKIKSESKYAFVKSFIRYKYYLQAVWYSRALVTLMKEKYPDYTLLNFTFLVTSFEYPDPPLLYECTNEVIDLGIKGGFIGDKKVKGILQLFDDYLWYKREEKFNYPREVYENRGRLNIDFHKIYE